MATWPAEGYAVWAELQSQPGRVALIMGQHADEPAERMAALVGSQTVSVGRILAEGFEQAPPPHAVTAAIAHAKVLRDIEVLFDPVLHVNPLRLLGDLSRTSGGVVAVWPGSRAGRDLVYAQPGRPGHFRESGAGCLLLHPVETLFDDQAPFTIERLV